MLILGNIFTDVEPICSLCLLLDSVIYGMFAKLFSLYIYLARMRIFSADVVKEFTDRVYVLIGVAVLFMVAYSLLRAIVDPEKNLKGNGFKIVINVVTSLAMLALIPTAFNILYDTVDILVVDNIVGKLFLGNDTGASETVSATYQEVDETGNYVGEASSDELTGSELNTELLTIEGRDTAWQVLKAFLYPTNDNPDDITIDNSTWTTSSTVKTVAIGSIVGMTVALVAGTVLAIPTGGLSFAGVMAAIASVGGTTLLAGTLAGAAAGGITSAAASLTNYATAEKISYTEFELGTVMYGDFDRITSMASNIQDGEITYVPIISTICGGALLYFIVCFCIELGVRSARLAFYEILAPIPILLRIVPGKEKVFSGWIKSVIKNFFSVLIRILPLFAIVTLISKIPEFNFTSTSMNLLAKAILIMGLIIFAKEIPKVIGEMTGIDTKDMGMGSNLRELLKAGGAFAAGGFVTGTLASGSLMGGIRGASFANREGTVGSMFHVASHERAHKRNVKRARAQGSTWTMRRMDGVRSFLGMESLADAAERKIDDADYTVKDKYYDKKTGTNYEGDVVMTGAKTREVEQNKAQEEFEISKLNSEKREVQGYKSNAEKAQGYRDNIKNLADSKIADGNSDVKPMLEYVDEDGDKYNVQGIEYKDKDGGVHVISGNYATLAAGVKAIQDNTGFDISDDSRSQLTTLLDNAKVAARTEYIRRSIDDKLPDYTKNNAIHGAYQQLQDFVGKGMIQYEDGTAYDVSRVSDKTGWDYIDSVYKDAGEIVRKAGVKVSSKENEIYDHQQQVDRYSNLLEQVEKQKAKAKKDSTFLAYKATKDIPKNENGTGFPGPKSSGK